MREVSEALAAHLGRSVTMLAHCWRLTREDGVVLGFTDHDETLAFDGTRFEARAGLGAGEAEAALGLSAGTQEVEGALSSLAIEERDIRAGRYDGATVEVFLVDWGAPENRLLLEVADLGEIKRDGTGFAAELRGIESRLDRVRGRLYRRRCDAVFGDPRCRVDLDGAGLRVEAVAEAAGGGSLMVRLAGEADAEGFRNGRLEVLSGDAEGLRFDLAGLRDEREGVWRLSLVEMPDDGIAAGDRVRVRAGCDKSFGTCRKRYGNHLNFRGFPHLPGTETALMVAKKDGVHDGSPLVP